MVFIQQGLSSVHQYSVLHPYESFKAPHWTGGDVIEKSNVYMRQLCCLYYSQAGPRPVIKARRVRVLLNSVQQSNPVFFSLDKVVKLHLRVTICPGGCLYTTTDHYHQQHQLFTSSLCTAVARSGQIVFIIDNAYYYDKLTIQHSCELERHLVSSSEQRIRQSE